MNRKRGSKNWEMLKSTITACDKSVERVGKRRRKTKPVSAPQNDKINIRSTHQLQSTQQSVVPSKVSYGCLSKDISTNITQRIAMDCEMVGSGKNGTENQLARVSIVNVHGEVLYDKIVKPREAVVDYRTHITGIDKSIITEHGIPFKLAQEEVAEMLKDKIVIGHDIRHDFEVLGFSHPKHLIRDTSKFKPFKDLAKGNKPSLKRLCKEVLQKNIQDGAHNSVEDAVSALLLYKKYRPSWERNLKKKSHKNKNCDELKIKS